MHLTYKHTKIACYCGYVVQAVIVNLPPLLFVLFQKNYGISNEQLGRLVLLCFLTQLAVDLAAGIFAERIGIRRCILAAHIFAALGLTLLGILPGLLSTAPYTALVIPTLLYSVGAGFIEVIISPTIEALPGDGKSASMSILHSFYCWGQMGAVLLSTLFLLAFGQQRWYLLPILWALVPACNCALFLRVPLAPPQPQETLATLREIFSSRTLRLCFAVMLCAGASELAMSQWASMFAEQALGVTKAVGDLAGPCLFALLMGLTRAFGCRLSEKLDFTGVLLISAGLCIICYMTAVFSGLSALSLLGCAATGMSIALMWPTTLSLAANRYPNGGTRMFALLAVFGDLGCSLGPWLTGFVSDRATQIPALAEHFRTLSPTQLGLKAGLLAAVIFPAAMAVCLLGIRKARTKT